MFNGEVHYQSYNEIMERVRNFDVNYPIGKDASGNYDLYIIELGKPENPTIFITSSIHGNEWHVTQMTLSTLEMLRDDTYPDADFRNNIMENFHIVNIPMVNPWGVDNVQDVLQVSDRGRRNYNNVDLNRDFLNRSQPETRIVMEQLDKFKPFAHIDNHMYQSHYGLANGKDMIVYIENNNLHYIRDNIRNDLVNYTGHPIETWDTVANNERMAVNYLTWKPNPHTPDTLTILTEIERPTRRPEGHVVRTFTPEDLYNYGNYYTYSYLKYAMQYYNEHYEEMRPEIPEIPGDLESGLFVSRNRNGLTETITKRRNGRDTVSVFIRNLDGYVTSVETEVKEV